MNSSWSDEDFLYQEAEALARVEISLEVYGPEAIRKAENKAKAQDAGSRGTLSTTPESKPANGPLEDVEITIERTKPTTTRATVLAAVKNLLGPDRGFIDYEWAGGGLEYLRFPLGAHDETAPYAYGWLGWSEEVNRGDYGTADEETIPNAVVVQGMIYRTREVRPTTYDGKTIDVHDQEYVSLEDVKVGEGGLEAAVCRFIVAARVAYYGPDAQWEIN